MCYVKMGFRAMSWAPAPDLLGSHCIYREKGWGNLLAYPIHHLIAGVLRHIITQQQCGI